MDKSIAVLGTLDTKGQEVQFLRQQILDFGCQPVVLDVGVVGVPGSGADVTREEIAQLGGTPLTELLVEPTRERAAPVMIRGASVVLQRMMAGHQVHGVVGLGGTQGTSIACGVMQNLPYGFPKLMVSTCAAGDTTAFVGVKDITMMFSVSDILGLNRFMRTVLRNAAAAVCGMAAQPPGPKTDRQGKPTIGISNLGVLTEGAKIAKDYLEQFGYETILFHAVGAGGRAMEQMMRDGLIQGVFDYALGEIADELFGGLRAGGPERLTVAGTLGLPQVICPGGAEHMGVFLQHPFALPAEYAGHQNVFHSPIIAAPRLKADQLVQVAQEIGQRLQHTRDKAVVMIPLRGVSRYSIPGGPLHDPAGDAAFFAAIKSCLPTGVSVREFDTTAEDPGFVRACCDRLMEMMPSP
jgi:uncharacterized protein (UPF0261 family)